MADSKNPGRLHHVFDNAAVNNAAISTAEMMLNPLHKEFWKKLRDWERGFTLIEAVAATFIAGTVVVGSVIVMGTAVRTAASTSGDLELQQLVQVQIETIQQLPYSEAGDYPLFTEIPDAILPELPDGVVIAFTTSDAGTNYRYPKSDGGFITNVVQQVNVTASITGGASVTMSFYKIEVP